MQTRFQYRIDTSPVLILKNTSYLKTVRMNQTRVSEKLIGLSTDSSSLVQLTNFN